MSDVTEGGQAAVGTTAHEDWVSAGRQKFMDALTGIEGVARKVLTPVQADLERAMGVMLDHIGSHPSLPQPGGVVTSDPSLGQPVPAS